jgi:uncharacterized iron-regulated membrane protein
MTVIGTFVRHPRKLFLRRALFQIHLWAGVLLSVYVVVLALTGSVLVFRSELQRAILLRSVEPYTAGKVASIATVLARFGATYPTTQVENLQLPFDESPVFEIEAKDGGRQFTVLANSETGTIYSPKKSWLYWVYELHVYLLLGHAYGMQVNAVGAAVLLILCATGLVIWWPGIKVWTRGLRVAFGRSWRRVNFDLHSAIGIWTLVLVSWWALSGVYFGFYKEVSAAVGWISPLRGMVSPTQPQTSGTGRVSLDRVLTAVQQVSPGGRLYSISDPALVGGSVYALVDLRAAGDFSHRDIVTVSTSDARILTVWHYGQNKTAGDWIIWAMHPLHFGTLWGLWVKVLWAVVGVLLAVLSATGVLMYWNRWLRHQF